jgi:NTP pyrophosphatase (non-canonical NTP hydrolase)
MHGFAPYGDLHRERIRAHNKHKSAPHGSMEVKSWEHPIWLPVVTEEIGEVARVICDNELGLLDLAEVRAKLREELVQVGAMVAAWIDAIDSERGIS